VIEIIPVHAHVDAPDGNRVAPDPLEQMTKAIGQVNAAALHSNDDHRLAVVVALDNFVGNAGQDAMDGLGVEDDGIVRHEKTDPGESPFGEAEIRFSSWLPWRPRWAALKDAAGKPAVKLVMVRCLAPFAPLGAMFDDPVGQGPLESDVEAGFLGLDPLVLQDFLPFGLEFLVESRVLQQVVPA